MKNLINEEVLVELSEVECDGGERMMSVIDYYEEFGYDSEGGKLIKKYGSDVIRDEYVKKIKKICKENGEEFEGGNWDGEWYFGKKK
jgi:hypothetical protein